MGIQIVRTTMSVQCSSLTFGAAFSVAGAHTVPVSQTKTISLLQKAIDCPGFKASLQADVNTKVNAKVTVGVAAEGTISPPVVSKVGFFMGLEGDFSGQVTVKSSLSASCSSPP